MDFSWTEDEQAFEAHVLEFAREQVERLQAASLESPALLREQWRRFGDFGVQGLPFPAAHGGREQTVVKTVLAFETLGYAGVDAGLLFSLAAQMWSVQVPIWRHGSDAQREKYLRPLCAGHWIGAHAFTEADSGSDGFAMQTTYRVQGDEYVLNGGKAFVTNAPIADVFVIFARNEDKPGFIGTSAFLVERETPGLGVLEYGEKLGLRSSPMGDVRLEGCRVGKRALLGREGLGASVFADSMNWERACILAHEIGAMTRQLESTRDHANQRGRPGSPIAQHQAVSHRIVDMKVRLEASRLLLYRAAFALDRGEDATMPAAIAKLHASEAFVASSLESLQIHGGRGYMRGSQQERLLCDALAGRLYSGSSEVQRNVVARCLGLHSGPAVRR